MNSLAPIVLFTYNRLDHTKQTIEALAHNNLAKESDLYVFSDGAGSKDAEEDVQKVRNYLKNITGFKKVELAFSEQNKGLAKSIIDGVSKVFENNERVIVLEDDLETSPYFLQYMNDALDYYKPDEIWSVAGYTPAIQIPETYTYNTYLVHRNCSWGWATWKQNWQKTDWNVKDFQSFFENKSNHQKFNRGGNDLAIMLLKQQQNIIHSWSIRFNYAAFKHNLPTVYPCTSLVKNQGVDGSGTNMKSSKKYHTQVNQSPVDTVQFCPSDYFDTTIEDNFKGFYNTSLFRRVINYFKIKKYLMS